MFDIYETTISFRLHDIKKNIYWEGEQGFLDEVYTEV